jgi:hypothetical protein
VKMGPILCPETSVNNYHTTPRNIPEERRSFRTLIRAYPPVYAVRMMFLCEALNALFLQNNGLLQARHKFVLRILKCCTKILLLSSLLRKIIGRNTEIMVLWVVEACGLWLPTFWRNPRIHLQYRTRKQQIPPKL